MFGEFMKFSRSRCRWRNAGIIALAVIAFSMTLSTHADDLENLMSFYQIAQPALDDPSSPNAFYLNVDIEKYRQIGEAAVYFDQSVSELAESLSNVRNWCQILILHLNTKACTYNTDSEGRHYLTVYLGRKFYQDPDDAFVMTYQFETSQQENYFSALITAKKGPLGTSNYRIQLEVTGIGDRTFGRFQVSQKQSWISSKAAKLYIATSGRSKRGISVVGEDENGNPIFSKGERAIAERNLLRYYFAFSAFFNTATASEETRFIQRMNNWYDQTEQYDQLYEVERAKYIEDKQKEYDNQVALQRSKYVDQETYKNL